MENQYQDLVGEPFTVWGGAGPSQAGPCCLTNSLTVRELYGITSSSFMDEDYSASISGNPSRIMYGHVWANSWTQSADAIAMRVAVHIIFDVEFYERVDLDDSFQVKEKLELLYNHLCTKPRPFLSKTIEGVSSKQTNETDSNNQRSIKLLNLKKAIEEYNGTK